jgi:hypothetical protein
LILLTELVSLEAARSSLFRSLDIGRGVTLRARK